MEIVVDITTDAMRNITNRKLVEDLVKTGQLKLKPRKYDLQLSLKQELLGGVVVISSTEQNKGGKSSYQHLVINKME